MAKPKPARRGRPPAGRIKTMVSLEPAQLAALRREAFRRAAGDVRARPDVSSVLREIVRKWMRRGK